VYVPLDIDRDARLSILANDLEWKVLHVTLNILVIELASDKTLDVKDGPVRVRGVLILG